ncbi:MAG: thiamine pyrophosphate-binding protein [Chloroflexi bacterium]|nr:thiamine pyrophosphate-binding protein [Chloroflexota bacterium]MCI0803939.1 thiamine pyrophosphate-binding protein [Chloroflexota bacterium]MCI0836905.1 thiamine pyrophosphate-binding protein [Chloroflexota bacterium]MCI0851492.1 thiamine pyrophosphate-binding protein [Chloroflexota bacterium]MCI0871561.1 thiamine pyrophosphate-binding protein [Chloroflexota bacterium]
MPMMSGAHFLAETLHGYGVSHFFFMPVIVPDAMPELERLGITRVMTHGEKPAAYMADAYARVSRSVGFCGAQSVGAANLAAGLQDAYLACSPVVALTGRLPQDQQDRNAYQEVDHGNPFSAVTKYSTRVNTVDQFPMALRQAIRESTTGTPGPAHLDLSGIAGGDIAAKDADLEVVIEGQFASVPPFRPEPDAGSVNDALGEISRAATPVIVAGGGVTASNAGKELVELAERLNVPVATALNAKETFPFDHPLAVGVPGSYSRACANQVLAEADLVFFVGSHTGGQVTNDWKLPRPGTRIVQLDINAAELGRSFPIAVGLQADVRAGLQKMLDASGEVGLPIDEQQRASWISRVQQLVGDWKDSVDYLWNSDDEPMRPERLCKELTDLMPSDAILVSDTGHSGIWTGTMMDLTHPGQSYIRCAGSLGWAFPAAFGAKAAAPDRPVICFTGDGGLWYHFTELDTGLRYGINTVTIVNNNASLNQEQALNERIYRGRTSGSDEMWMLSDADFAAMAESMGGFGIRVDRPGELEGALDQALNAGKPAVIDVKTHIEGIAPRAWDG